MTLSYLFFVLLQISLYLLYLPFLSLPLQIFLFFLWSLYIIVLTYKEFYFITTSEERICFFLPPSQECYFSWASNYLRCVFSADKRGTRQQVQPQNSFQTFSCITWVSEEVQKIDPNSKYYLSYTYMNTIQMHNVYLALAHVLIHLFLF